MLLQELFLEENKNLKEIYSVELNEESSKPEYASPPDNLEEIGFVFKVDNENMMEENLMDVVISYRLTNLPVVMEIPTQLFTKNGVEVKYLIQLANNVDFAISLLPPGHPLVKDEVSTEEYKKIVLEFLDEILNRPNFDRFIYPISNYFEYLMLENILGENQLKDFRPENRYIVNNFATVLTENESNDFKLAIKNKLYDFYGGKENFDLMAKKILESVYEKTQDVYVDYMKQVTQNNQEIQNQKKIEP
jgi:hypothetical protein